VSKFNRSKEIYFDYESLNKNKTSTEKKYSIKLIKYIRKRSKFIKNSISSFSYKKGFCFVYLVTNNSFNVFICILKKIKQSKNSKKRIKNLNFRCGIKHEMRNSS